NDPLAVAAQRLEELLGIDEVRERDHEEHQHRNDGKQSVVRHRAGEEESLVLLEGLEGLQEKPARACERLRQFGAIQAASAASALLNAAHTRGLPHPLDFHEERAEGSSRDLHLWALEVGGAARLLRHLPDLA